MKKSDHLAGLTNKNYSSASPKSQSTAHMLRYAQDDPFGVLIVPAFYFINLLLSTP